MTITAAVVLYSVIWFLALFVALPIGETSQQESGEVVPGTPASAPVDAMFKKKIIWVTIVSTVLWAITCAIILSGVISVESLDLFNRMDTNREAG